MASRPFLPATSRWSLEASTAAGFSISISSLVPSPRRGRGRRGVHVHSLESSPSPPDASSTTYLGGPSPSSTADVVREVPSSQTPNARDSSQLGTSPAAADGVVGVGEPSRKAVAAPRQLPAEEHLSLSKWLPMFLKSFAVQRVLRSFRKRPLWRRIFFASKKVRGVILLNVLTIIYASDIPVLKEVEAVVDPALFTMVRFTLSALPLLPFAFQARGDTEVRSAGIELGCWVSLGYLAQAIGLVSSDAGRASFISAFTVITVPLIDGLFGSMVPALTWCGALISLLGVALLESSGSPPNVGDLLNMLSAVFFGIHMLRTEHVSRVTKKEKYISLLGYEVIVIMLCSIIWYFFKRYVIDLEEVSSSSLEWPIFLKGVVSFPWIPAFYTGIFSTGLCLWAEMLAMSDISATEAAIIYGLEPLWGAAFAWIGLDERWDTLGWIGATLILGGSLTVQTFGSPPVRARKDGTDGGRSDRLDVLNRPDDATLSAAVVDARKDSRKLPNNK